MGLRDQKPTETVPTREWARAEYAKKTKGLRFTKDFQSRQEAVMRDPLSTVGERVMAWILRRSWGEYVLYAIREDGEPAYQRDCSRELEIDKKQVSNAVRYYQRRGYLENHPKRLYPVISPALSAPDPNCKKSQEFVTFYEQWKVTHSSDFQALEDARSTIKRIRKVVLSEYKKSKHPPQNAGPSLLRDKENNTETVSSSSAVQSLPHPDDRKAEEDNRTPYQRFKAEYPAERFDEAKVKPSFEGRTKAQQAHILERLRVYLNCERWHDAGGQWIPWAHNWLRDCDADPPAVFEPRKTKSKSRSALDAFLAQGD